MISLLFPLRMRKRVTIGLIGSGICVRRPFFPGTCQAPPWSSHGAVKMAAPGSSSGQKGAAAGDGGNSGRCSTLSMDHIRALSDLPDLEAAYSCLCAEEV